MTCLDGGWRWKALMLGAGIVACGSQAAAQPLPWETVFSGEFDTARSSSAWDSDAPPQGLREAADGSLLMLSTQHSLMLDSLVAGHAIVSHLRADGTLAWSQLVSSLPTTAWGYSSRHAHEYLAIPMADAGIVTAAGGNVTRLEADGSLRWTLRGDVVGLAVTPLGDIAIASECTVRLLADEDGRLLQTRDLLPDLSPEDGCWIYGFGIDASGGLYAYAIANHWPSYSGARHVMRLSSASLSTLWKKTIDHAYDFAIGPDAVYRTYSPTPESLCNNVEKRSALTGEVEWAYRARDRCSITRVDVAPDGQRVLVFLEEGDSKPTIIGLDARNGRALWSYSDPEVWSATATRFIDGQYYVMANDTDATLPWHLTWRDGELLRFDTRLGRPTWRTKVPVVAGHRMTVFSLAKRDSELVALGKRCAPPRFYPCQLRTWSVDPASGTARSSPRDV